MYSSFREARRAVRGELRRTHARFKRGQSKATFIAVTGSSAKTTTSALLSHILSGDEGLYLAIKQQVEAAGGEAMFTDDEARRINGMSDREFVKAGETKDLSV